MGASSTGTLYIVPTPIGNLEDLSRRTEKVLSECDLLACEDTRVSGRLLSFLSLSIKMISYREENEVRKTEELSEFLASGKKVALLSDAGYPSISDPGFRLVRECHRRGISIVPLPGPNAALTALAASGLPTHQFLFLGFLPKKASGIKNLLKRWEDFEGSLIFYESKYKIEKTLLLLCESYGDDRYVCLARELTKLHETILSGPLSLVIEKFRSGSSKGEFTLVVGPKNYSFGNDKA